MIEMPTTCDSGGAVLPLSRAVLSLMSAAVVWLVKCLFFVLRQKYQFLSNLHRSVTPSRACPASSTGKSFCMFKDRKGKLKYTNGEKCKNCTLRVLKRALRSSYFPLILVLKKTG